MTRIYIKQGQPNQWTLAFEGLENPNFLNANVQCVCGHGGCSGSIQAKHHFVHVHHPPFDLALHCPKFSSLHILSQGCDCIVQALGLNRKARNCCLCEGVSLLAFFFFAILVLVLLLILLLFALSYYWSCC